MNLNVTILSREAAEELIRSGFPRNSAVIQFYDRSGQNGNPGHSPIHYYGLGCEVYPVPLQDIGPGDLPEYGLTFDSYFPQAEILAGFIDYMVHKGRNIICQCESGQTSSAACAAAIREFYTHDGIEVFADYRYHPNQLIFRKLLAALRSLAQTRMDNI